jgi:hypothetical protein
MAGFEKLAVGIVAAETATIVERQFASKVASEVVEQTIAHNPGVIAKVVDAVVTTESKSVNPTTVLNLVTKEAGTATSVTGKVVPGAAAKQGGIKGVIGKVLNPISAFFGKAAQKTERVGKAGKYVLRSGEKAEGFGRLRKVGGNKMVRVLNEDRMPGIVERIKNRIHFGTKIEYVVGETGESAGKNVRRIKGVVFNEGLKDAKIVRGSVNMTAENAKLYKHFDNKLNEAAFLQRFAPGSVAKTESMADLISKLGLKTPAANATAAEKQLFLQQLEDGLRQQYPKGFFIKGIKDFNTGGNLIHDRVGNFAKMHEGFLKEYAPARDKILAANKGAGDPAAIIQSSLRDHPFASGRTLEELMANPKNAIVQERMELAKWTTKKLPRDVQPFDEFRLHVVDGNVVPGATSHRWSITETVDRVDELGKIESWAQQQFAKFPRGVRQRLSFAPDVVRLEDGSYKFIELNVGGESGFLYRNPLAANAVTEAVTGQTTVLRTAIKPLAYVAQGISAVTTPVLKGLSNLFRVGG